MGPGFSKPRTAQLHKVGLKRVEAVWQGNAFLSVDIVKELSSLRATESGAWKVATLAKTWVGLLSGISPTAKSQEWLGIFVDHLSHTLEVVFQARQDLALVIGLGPRRWWLLRPMDRFHVLPESCTFATAGLPISQGENGRRGSHIQGHLKRVQVVEFIRGPKKTVIRVFYGKTLKLTWDPVKFTWPKQQAARDYRAGA
jgi:hypothetical protein